MIEKPDSWPSRTALQGAAAVIVACASVVGTTTGASAQQYPERPVKVVVGFPAGSGADILCRYFVEGMAKVSGSTFVIENKPGATGNIGSETVARSKPDGYTLLMGASSNMAGGPNLYKNLTWHPQKDFDVVSTFAQLGFVLTIAAASPAKTVPEFTSLMKAKAGKATFGFGNTSGLAASSLYAHEAGFQVTSVAYKSNPQAVSDVAEGQIDYVFSDALFAMSQQKVGKVRLLAVTTPERLSSLPDLPTMGQAGLPAVAVAPWWALFAPVKTPPEILAKLDGWLNTVARQPEAREFLVKQGIEPLPGTAAKTREMLAASLKEWARIVELAKITPQ
jgi:tripartite-type tricarboxylate transporter receptor subunit TctC